MRKVSVVIIGGGSAGLTAFREARKTNTNVLLINEGEDGTTCARVGCMPSKAFIQVAQDYSHTKSFTERGIENSDQLKINFNKLMQHVRSLRDHFVEGILQDINKIGPNYLKGKVKFLSLNTLEVNGEVIEANKIVIATGSRPSIPDKWKEFSSLFTTSDDFFELTEPPKSMAIIGLGGVGLEIGLALSQLGIKVTGFCHNMFIGGLSDPQVNKQAIEIISKEFPMFLEANIHIKHENNQFIIRDERGEHLFEKVLIATGRIPNMDKLGIEKLSLAQEDKKIPLFDPHTMRIENSPIYLAGDVTAQKAVLPQALDEGFIAGYNAAHEIDQAFVRRCDLFITFTDPTICIIGKNFSSSSKESFISGEVHLENQGRAVIMKRNAGIIKIYAEPKRGQILGAELVCPEGEHLAHLLAFYVQKGLTAEEALKLPFYHPVLEESLQTALKNLSSKINAVDKKAHTRLEFAENNM